MRIAIGADHAGFALKQHLNATLRRLGHDVDDLGTHSETPVDYPPICAERSARAGRRAAAPIAASSSAAAARASRSPRTRSPACARRCATTSTPRACPASTTTPTSSRWAGGSSRRPRRRDRRAVARPPRSRAAAISGASISPSRSNTEPEVRSRTRPAIGEMSMPSTRNRALAHPGGDRSRDRAAIAERACIGRTRASS